jgi:glycosyltransferase involved in cell wall biosynthesis
MKQNKKLHIFHLLFTNKMGGLEQAYLDYTQALLLRGHKITAIVAPDAPYLGELAKLEVEVICLRTHGFYDVFAWLRLRKLLRSAKIANLVKPIVVLAHNGRAIFTAYQALRGLAMPIIGVSHSNNIKYSKKANGLLVLTEAMRGRFLAAGYSFEKCAVIGNMIELADLSTEQKWQKQNPSVIGFLGRLSSEKGVADLLQGLAILRAKNLLVNVKIGGAGEEENSLRALAEKLSITEQVEFCGWIANNDKADFFASIDVLCVPSSYETFGIVVLEAWAAGVPVIAAEVGGLAEIITNGENGLLYPRANVAVLAENIEKLLFVENELAQKLVANGKINVKKYGMVEGAERLEKILFALLEKLPANDRAAPC